MGKICVDLVSGSYEVVIGDLPDINLDVSVLLVTTNTVGSIYLNYILSKIRAKEVNVCLIEDGEEHKNMASVERILDFAFRSRLDRSSMMIALGGGVITDLVGFASGVYHRGIGFISIPTTLLAMVDASIGGKCGINNSYGKNLVGLFHQPYKVFIDLRFLDSLPKREILSGASEIVKIVSCFDFELLKHISFDSILSYVEHAVSLKVKVVMSDERETLDLRSLLNYGHTFGHAIELEGNYVKHLHGEAVSIGMVMANELSVGLGLMSRSRASLVKDTLRSLGLPTSYKIVDVDRFCDRMYSDKKRIGSNLSFVLLNDKGVGVYRDVERQVLVDSLASFA